MGFAACMRHISSRADEDPGLPAKESVACKNENFFTHPFFNPLVLRDFLYSNTSLPLFSQGIQNS